jgi:hypothetical protein
MGIFEIKILFISGGVEVKTEEEKVKKDKEEGKNFKEFFVELEMEIKDKERDD